MSLADRLDRALAHRWADRPVQALIVDDDQAIRETLSQMLRDEGFDAIEASDGGEALALLRAATQPTLALLDMWMPVVSGETALLAALALAPTLRVRLGFIVMTASPQLTSTRVQAAMRSLDIPLLVKPFDIDTLIELVYACSERLSDGVVVRRARSSGSLA